MRKRSQKQTLIIVCVLAALVLGIVELLVKKGVVPHEKQTEYIGWSAVATGVIAAAIKLAFS